MAGFMDILGTLMQQGMSQSSGTRMSSAFGAGTSGGSLSDIMDGLSKMMGGTKAGHPAQAGTTGGLGGMLGDVLNNIGNNRAATGGLGALVGAILGGGGSSARGAVGGGSLALLASLAFSALKKAGQQPQQPPKALVEPETPEEKESLERDAEKIVKAMINAAKADGRIDETEVQKIVGKLEKDGLTEEEKRFFEREAKKPMDLDAVVRSAEGRPQLAAQIYTASLLAIEVDTEAEKQYMQQLASGLGLNRQVTGNIESFLGMA
ncbi:MAG: tellurite resistance TerB family protein [Desulforhopalus sp.]